MIFDLKQLQKLTVFTNTYYCSIVFLWIRAVTWARNGVTNGSTLSLGLRTPVCMRRVRANCAPIKHARNGAVARKQRRHAIGLTKEFRFCWSDFRPATFGHNERRIDEAFFFIQRAVFTKLVGNVRQNQTQNLVAAPSLKASMHSFVVRIALRQHVPLRTCVDPQHCFQHMTGRDRFTSSTPIGNMLLRKMLPNALPLFVRQPNHSSFIADRQQSGILRWVLTIRVLLVLINISNTSDGRSLCSPRSCLRPRGCSS